MKIIKNFLPKDKFKILKQIMLGNNFPWFYTDHLAANSLIVEEEGAPDINDKESFFIHLLERVDWSRDMHFQTMTTIDTLDYSGEGLNEGSKLIIAAAGPKKRNLLKDLSLL